MPELILVIWMITSAAALVGFIAPQLFRVKKRVYILAVYIGSTLSAMIGIGVFHEPQTEAIITVNSTPKQQKYDYQPYEYIDSTNRTLLVKGRSSNPWDSTAPIRESNAFKTCSSWTSEDIYFTIPPNTKTTSTGRYSLLLNGDTAAVYYRLEHNAKEGWISQSEVEVLR